MSILDARAAKPTQGGASFTLQNRLCRIVFRLVWLSTCRWTPRSANRWRVLILRLFGARIQFTATVYGSARIWLPGNLVMEDYATLGPHTDCYNIAPVKLEAHAIVSQRAVLCTGTHDHSDPAFQLYARPITVGLQAWVAAEAFVGPGVIIGPGAVLGARAAAFADLDAWIIYSGNPAMPLGPRKLGVE
ncbi:putative colanic acid biosynthesis acetyltransferase [Altererythrobacter aquiaggeris]|uniref:putative colanic acid biosynthesis acetyltransferase n=1 Tax=Aestuarierythrobacter aquiaggeris TaxID=1898396 RepID=UPI003016B30A